MVNEERVKELCKLAMYDSKNSRVHQQVTQFFKADYVGKELLKSFFSGTISFAIIMGLMIVYRMDWLLENINSMDLMGTATKVVLLYFIFLGVYLFITGVIYTYRYSKERKQLREYVERLKRVNKMYERDNQ